MPSKTRNPLSDGDDEAVSLLREYLGIEPRAVGLFGGLIVAVFAAVTGIYVAIFGFDQWKTDMQRAGSMMIIEFPAPSRAAALPARAQGAPPQSAAQYVCPRCGAVGLPVWSQAGTPLCPQCTATMSVVGERP